MSLRDVTAGGNLRTSGPPAGNLKRCKPSRVPGGLAGAFCLVQTMDRYAVLNVGSGEILSPWYTTEARAHEVAAECESHETQPDCNVVRFSEWAPRRRLVALRNERWEGAYPLVTFGPDWSWVFTGEIVSAQEPGITVTECGRAAYRRGG